MAEKDSKHAEVTPELVARRISRANKPFYPRQFFFNTQATKDAILHFVNGIGDLNPLFRDEEYAKNTKYGRIIAPGSFLYTIGGATPGVGLAGIHGWQTGGEWEWYRPIYEGDEFKVVDILRELVEKAGRMGKGKTWIDYYDTICINQKGEIVGKQKGWLVFASRAASGATSKYRHIPRPVYSKEELQRIHEMYDNEEIRGSSPRYWEDVQVGDNLGPMVKGPLSVRDILTWLMGSGSPFLRAHRIEHEYEKRHPKILQYVKELDMWDVPELVHFLDPFAREIGVERAYDYGPQRTSWLCNLVSNWMGDDGFLWKLRGDLRAFNLVGDVTFFEGKVTKKYREGDKCCVDIEAWAKNQRDEYSMIPNPATIILPSKQYGAVVYPEPPATLYEEVQKARPLDEMIEAGQI